jgi:hypothetical protein
MAVSGYHHSGACHFDLWAPGERTDVENRAFSPYAKHMQELEDIIQSCVEAALRGETNLTFDLDDDLSDEDLAYIQSEIQKRV